MNRKYEFISKGKIRKAKKIKKHEKSCECNICKRNEKFRRYMVKLKMGPTKKKFFEDLYNSLIHAEFDRDWNLAKLEKFKNALGIGEFRKIYQDVKDD